jgi:hypothetical protein
MGMKPYNEQEFNKLCAEFLGIKKSQDLYVWNLLLFSEDELLFHSDWNWIMEVVEKIHYFKTLIISNNHCEVHFMIEDNMRINVCVRTTKEAVVEAIWQFLNWYNEQKL